MSRRFTLFFLPLCIACCLGVSTASAQVVDIAASDNAWVFRNNGGAGIDQDQNESQSLTIKGNGDNVNTRFAYLRFDPSAFTTVSQASDLTAAAFEFYFNVSTAGGDHTLHVHALLDGAVGETTWTESITYNTRPGSTANVPNASTTGSLGSFLMTPTSPAGEVSISLDLATMIGLLENDTNGEITFVLVTTGSSNPSASIASLDNTSGFLVPTLSLDATPVPEPSTFALGLFGLPIFFAWRRYSLRAA